MNIQKVFMQVQDEVKSTYRCSDLEIMSQYQCLKSKADRLLLDLCFSCYLFPLLAGKHKND